MYSQQCKIRAKIIRINSNEPSFYPVRVSVNKCSGIVTRWNKDKCGYECKTLIDIGMCDKGLIWNPSNYDYECGE